MLLAENQSFGLTKHLIFGGGGDILFKIIKIDNLIDGYRITNKVHSLCLTVLGSTETFSVLLNDAVQIRNVMLKFNNSFWYFTEMV